MEDMEMQRGGAPEQKEILTRQNEMIAVREGERERERGRGEGRKGERERQSSSEHESEFRVEHRTRAEGET
jgi:hypothetical protein